MEKIKSLLYGAGSLLDITGSQGTEELRNIHIRSKSSGILKHTRGIKRHFVF